MLEAYCIEGVVEAGCDEAGRGPLAGSVFAAAVILDPLLVGDKIHSEWLEMLNDSKQLTDKERQYLRPKIEQYATAWAVVEVTAEEIDEINILKASIVGMQRALDKLGVRPQHILVDGNKWKPYIPEGDVMEIPARTVVKGDGKYLSIAAASVLAKTYRDEYMLHLHEEYPQYHWNTNMGYPTKTHYQAIRQYGITPYHRKSFKLEKEV
ncbi:MAG: ribonuclease HII [Paludibacteraceae bacterium]|nr:ribonuclease HII [Paludibacteraceae bacterium]